MSGARTSRTPPSDEDSPRAEDSFTRRLADALQASCAGGFLEGIFSVPLGFGASHMPARKTASALQRTPHDGTCSLRV